MRKSVIGMVLALVAVELFLVFWNPGDSLPLNLQVAIGSWGMNLSLLLVPAIFVFMPPKKSGRRLLAVRIPAAVLVSWLLSLQFRMNIQLPGQLKLAEQNGNTMYDGAGMNAAMLLTGWVLPLFVTLGLLLAREAILLLKDWITNG